MGDRVTREDLAEAYRAIGPEDKEEEEVVEEETAVETEESETEEVEELEVAPEDEELSPADKSKLGRKLADEKRERKEEREKLESQLREMSEKIAKTEGLIEGIGRQGPETAPPEELDPDETLTRGEMEELLHKREVAADAIRKDAESKQRDYSEKYSNLVYEKLEDNPNKDEILKLFKSDDAKYDKIVFGDPEQDFEYNLANAEREVLKLQNEKLSKELGGKNKKVREDDTDGAGIGGGSVDEKEDTKPKGTPSGMADNYLKWLDKKDKEAAKKLREKHY